MKNNTPRTSDNENSKRKKVYRSYNSSGLTSGQTSTHTSGHNSAVASGHTSARASLTSSPIDDRTTTTTTTSKSMNKKAVVIFGRVQTKLSGRDFGKSKSDKPLAVSTQVKLLIENATSSEYLAQAFMGWCPYW